MQAAGKHIVIRSDGLSDENTLEQPYRIVPREEALSNCAKSFTVTLPPRSVNVLVIPATGTRNP